MLSAVVDVSRIQDDVNGIKIMIALNWNEASVSYNTLDLQVVFHGVVS
jgi:hypothetical protein